MDEMLVQRSYPFLLNVKVTAVGEEGEAEVIACAEQQAVNRYVVTIVESNSGAADAADARFLLHVWWQW